MPLTGGGPARRTEVVSLYMYRSAFYDLDAGKAAAIAVVMLAINAALAWGAVRMIRRPQSAALSNKADLELRGNVVARKGTL